MTVARQTPRRAAPRTWPPAAWPRPAGGSSSATPAPATASSTSSRSTAATLVFVEVKATRAGAPVGPERPVLAVGRQKQLRIRRLAGAYLGEALPLPAFAVIRFDVIGISFDGGAASPAYEHIEAAF